MSTNSLPSPNIIRIVIDLRLIDANLVIVIRGNAGIPGYSPFLPAINGHRCETAGGCWYRSYYFHRFAPRRFRKTFICSIICYLFSGVHRFLPYRHRLCPAAGNRPARFQIENHCMVFRCQNLISPCPKNLFVEFVQAENCGTFFMQHFGRDSATHTALTVPYFMGLTYPYFWTPSVFTDIMGKLFSADTALDLSRETGISSLTSLSRSKFRFSFFCQSSFYNDSGYNFVAKQI